MVHLNPPMIKKTSEEIRNGKTEASKNMGMKKQQIHSHPLLRKRLPIKYPPMDLVSGLKKMLLYKTEQVGIGVLTRLPPMDFRFTSDGFARLPLHGRFLRCHGKMETRILSCFTLGG